MADDNKSDVQGSTSDNLSKQHQISTYLGHQSNILPTTENRRVNPQDSVSLKHKLVDNNTTVATQPPQLKHGLSNGAEHSHPDSGIGGSHANEDSMEYSLEGGDSSEKVGEEQPRSRGSQGSKETIMSTAEDWFSDLNREVQVNNNYLDFDDDPPYYQPVSSSRRKHPLPFKQQRPHKFPKTNTAASVRSSTRGAAQCPPSIVDENVFGGGAQAHMLGEGTSDSNSDSYRSVIDDLTVKNQKLKRRLRRLEELQAEHLQTDKLFELRIHGLSANKRQELENLLQQFTSSLHNSPSGSSANSGLTHESPTMNTINTMNGLTFNPVVTQQDSAYASNSGSGTLVTPSSVHPSLSSNNSKDSGRGNVKGEISEKTKMLLVVKRLEELFTGRRQSIQSMKRTQSTVTKANTNPTECANKQPEGARESLMMEARGAGGTTQRTHCEAQEPASSCADATEPISDSGLDQRPTRQLDLDLQREQIPSQNLEYLHNLTSSSTHEPIDLDGQWDGWVYLNLIINMAQLHTINVTLPFVKKAIANMSNKLELSPDGKMVRWKGGDENTTSPDSASHSRSDSDSKYPNSRSPIDGSSNSSRGRIKSDTVSMGLSQSQDKDSSNSDSRQSSNTRLGSGGGSGQRSGGLSGSHSFHYKPLFAQKTSSGDDSSEQESSSSSSSDSKSGSEGVDGAENPDGRRVRTKSRCGPIIYYENGNFCTDLSAQEVVVRDESTTPDYPYERMTNEVVGAPGKLSSPISDERSTFLHGHTLAGSPLTRVLEQDEASTEDEDMDGMSTMSFSPRLESTLPDHPPLPVELEASGIGGVTPEDNFAINVQIKHPLLPKGIDTRLFNSRKMRTKLRGIIHRIPQSTINVFLQDESDEPSAEKFNKVSEKSSGSASPIPAITLPNGRKYHLPVRHELVSARFIRLPPSALPPASYMFFSASSDDSSPDSDSGVNTRTSESDQSMESQGFDDSPNDMDDTDSSIRAREYLSNALFAADTSSYKDSPGSSSFENLALGRARTSDDIRETSLAATAGSADCQPMMNENEEVNDSLDSDELMEDFDSEGRDMYKSSDGDEQEVVGVTSRPMLKRMRSTKGSVDSLLAARKIMVV